MLEPAKHHGLIVIGPTLTILLFGEAAVLLRAAMIGVTVPRADHDGPVLDALRRLRCAVLLTTEAEVHWAVVDLRPLRISARD